MPFEHHLSRCAAHQLSQFVMYNLNQQLSRLYGRQNLLTHGFFLYTVGETFGDLIVNVGIEQRTSYFLKRFRYIDFGNFTFTLQYFKRAF